MRRAPFIKVASGHNNFGRRTNTFRKALWALVVLLTTLSAEAQSSFLALSASGNESEVTDVRITKGQVVTTPLGSISRDPDAAYLVGAYRVPRTRELLEVKRMGPRTLRFKTL